MPNASISLGRGILTLNFSETIDAASTSLVDLEKIFISNSSLDGEIQLWSQETASVLGSEAIFLQINLTEAQRVRAIEISGTTGGDGGGAFVDLQAAALQDMGVNTIDAVSATSLLEIGDSILPSLADAKLNLSTGELVLTSSETVDITPTSKIDLQKLFLSNATSEKNLPLEGAQVSNTVDGLTFTITLNETQRVTAIEMSRR